MPSDLSRLKELFYLQVGKGLSITLDVFIERALAACVQRTFSNMPTIVSYDSRGVVNSLSLTVYPMPRHHLASLNLSQFTSDVNNLLSLLEGNMRIIYPTKDHQSAVLEIMKSPSEGLMERASPHDHIIRRATSIEIYDDFFELNDPNRTLLNLRCIIRRQNPGYYFEYSLSTADRSTIPCLSIPNKLFELVAHKFTKVSLLGYTISNLTSQ